MSALNRCFHGCSVVTMTAHALMVYTCGDSGGGGGHCHWGGGFGLRHWKCMTRCISTSTRARSPSPSSPSIFTDAAGDGDDGGGDGGDGRANICPSTAPASVAVIAKR
ncbi:hypothetical protein PTSG_12849 [Salpingoeca rosetta]|uniref:Uncharacterized protein n=1 Tax=Salpingoeca rosetta (strain ATCC 50818 / BSB-021) TaxID=946362 RepID=F2UN27_SALR5|nr:uncharacterized protein PTSG_12849 [Salpingoeca rosetta]EGD78526.1 hypothetical protein PTSG_12849 [Salpingoeca rosetta]|eukprot:XP_004989475.1 hypothetical protein PTSG_12849 [Salpingoeca rosetta]